MFPFWILPFAVAIFFNTIATLFEYFYYDMTGKDWNFVFKFFLKHHALVPILCLSWLEDFLWLLGFWLAGGDFLALMYAFFDLGVCAADMFYRANLIIKEDLM